MDWIRSQRLIVSEAKIREVATRERFRHFTYSDGVGHWHSLTYEEGVLKHHAISEDGIIWRVISDS